MNACTFLQNHYPERLGMAVCYHAPTLFSLTWKVRGGLGALLLSLLCYVATWRGGLCAAGGSAVTTVLVQAASLAWATSASGCSCAAHLHTQLSCFLKYGLQPPPCTPFLFSCHIPALTRCCAPPVY